MTIGDPAGSGATASESRSAQAWRSYARNRLIESRLTPNAISMTGLILNIAAALLILEEAFLLGGIAFIVGSILDTLEELDLAVVAAGGPVVDAPRPFGLRQGPRSGIAAGILRTEPAWGLHRDEAGLGRPGKSDGLPPYKYPLRV